MADDRYPMVDKEESWWMMGYSSSDVWVQPVFSSLEPSRSWCFHCKASIDFPTRPYQHLPEMTIALALINQWTFLCTIERFWSPTKMSVCRSWFQDVSRHCFLTSFRMQEPTTQNCLAWAIPTRKHPKSVAIEKQVEKTTYRYWHILTINIYQQQKYWFPIPKQ